MDLESRIKNYFYNYDNDVDKIRKIFNVTAKDVERDVKILKEWIKKEPHLPQNLEDNFFEKMLLFNKFRVERAKQQIDALFTVKTVDPSLYSGLEKTRLINQSMVMYCMPTLMPNNVALLMWRLNIPDVDRFSLIDCLQNWMILQEWTIKYYYLSSVYLIIDLSGFTLGHIKRLNLNDAYKMIKLRLLPFSMRTTSIDIVNVPSAAVPFVNACKGFITGKLASKIRVFNKLDGVLDNIDLKYLPKDIGGTAESQEELIKKTDQSIELDYEYLKSLKDIRSDESKRIGEPIFRLQDFGPQGTFKRINVD